MTLSGVARSWTAGKPVVSGRWVWVCPCGHPAPRPYPDKRLAVVGHDKHRDRHKCGPRRINESRSLVYDLDACTDQERQAYVHAWTQHKARGTPA